MLLLAFRRVIWFTVLGAAAIVLVGPVLTVAGTILPFALVGALIWLAWRGAARLVSSFSLADVRGKLAAETVLPAAGAVGRRAGCAFRHGVQHCYAAAPVLREQARWMRSKLAAHVRTAVRMLVEIVCGAAVGAVVAWYTMESVEGAVAIGMLVGGALGFVVGGSKHSSTPSEPEA